MRFGIAVLISLVLCVSCYCSAGVTITVPGDHSTIQGAITAAADGDTIVVSSGTYIENINMSNKAVTLESTAPTDPAVVAATIIDGGGSGTVITCDSGEGAGTVIEGFTITNGNATYGGGMVISSSAPTVRNCTFRDNTANSQGGGMYVSSPSSSSAIIDNCTFRDNTGIVGGGIYSDSTFPAGSLIPVDINDSYFCGNSPSDVTGLYNDGGGNSFNAICPDADGDDVLDFDDNCPGTPNSGQEDYDRDGIGDACDDSDGDGVFDDIDNCLGTANAGQEDQDGDGTGDSCDDDYDNDGILDPNDNCVFTPNAGQEDQDSDGIGDVCDDSDGDGVFDDIDNCPGTANAGQEDADGDGVGDVCEIITVDDDGGADFTVIQDAIDFCRNGQSIIVYEGTYIENINMSGKAITLVSTYPSDPNIVLATIIDGSGALGVSVITCDSGEDANTVIDGFTITNGLSGGMRNVGSSPTVANCIFSGNENIHGSGRGGGMHNHNSSPMVINCTFSGNEVPNPVRAGGGGMYNENSSSPEVSNCTFSGNYALLDGGGMLNADSSPTVSNCTFSGNTARAGGGMFNNGSSPTVSNCIFSGNTARNYAGGMYNGGSSPTVSHCTFSGNTANSSGGGMLNGYSSPEVSHCTFSGNTASDSGGGMYNVLSSSPTVSHCILWGDTATTGNEIYNDISSPVISYSDIAGGYGGVGNIDADPLFIDADGDDDVVGTEDDNLRLSAGSPCIDAGDSTVVLQNPSAQDLDGNPRAIDAPAVANTGVTYVASAIGTQLAYAIDIGAYEFQPPGPIEGDIDGDGDVDMVDFAAFAANWLEGT